MNTKNILLITAVGVAGFLLLKNTSTGKCVAQTAGILVPADKTGHSNETNMAYPNGGLQVPESMDLPNLTATKKNGLTTEDAIQGLFKK